MKQLSNPLDSNSTLNMDNGGQGNNRKASGQTYSPKPSKVHLSKREEFEKLDLWDVYDKPMTFCLAELLGVKNTQIIWNWHITEMKALLERVEKEIIGKDETWGGYDGEDLVNDTDAFLINGLKNKQRQLLNNLKEEIK